MLLIHGSYDLFYDCSVVSNYLLRHVLMILLLAVDLVARFYTSCTRAILFLLALNLVSRVLAFDLVARYSPLTWSPACIQQVTLQLLSYMKISSTRP